MNSDHTYQDIVLALAGVFQSCQAVIDLANLGKANEQVMQASLFSLEQLDADTTEQVFGGKQEVNKGLRILQQQLPTGASGSSADLGRYVANVLSLERKLAKDQEMQQIIGTRINQIKRLYIEAEALDLEKIHAIAELYTDTIATFGNRIQVTGEPLYLKQPYIQDKIRCCLFSALRSAVLWRQVGGKRRQLLFSRKDLLLAVKQQLLGNVN